MLSVFLFALKAFLKIFFTILRGLHIASLLLCVFIYIYICCLLVYKLILFIYFIICILRILSCHRCKCVCGCVCVCAPFALRVLVQRVSVSALLEYIVCACFVCDTRRMSNCSCAQSQICTLRLFFFFFLFI